MQQVPLTPHRFNRVELLTVEGEARIRDLDDERDAGRVFVTIVDSVDDYWIVNLVERVLEVYRDPAPDADAVYGWGYRTRETLAPPGIVTPLALPATRIDVAAVVP